MRSFCDPSRQLITRMATNCPSPDSRDLKNKHVGKETGALTPTDYEPRSQGERREQRHERISMAVTSPQEHASLNVNGAVSEHATAATAKEDWRDPRYRVRRSAGQLVSGEALAEIVEEFHRSWSCDKGTRAGWRFMG